MLSKDKKYQLCGEYNPPVYVKVLSEKSLVCYDHPFYCEFVGPNNSTIIGDYFNKDGVGRLSGHTIKEVPIWKDWKIDKSIYVKSKEHKGDVDFRYLKRHFAGISKDGSPMIFSSGKTSWSHRPEFSSDVLTVPHDGLTFYLESVHDSDIDVTGHIL